MTHGLIVVGHPGSGYEDVHALLQTMGMEATRSGEEHGVVPARISVYVHTHAESSSGPLQSPAEITSALPVKPPVLDYWHELDPSCRFVLVFASPASCLARTHKGLALGPGDLSAYRQAWQQYHQALLQFHARHPDRCLLVHAESVFGEPQALAQAISTRFQLQFVLESEESRADSCDAVTRWLAGSLWCADGELEEYQALQREADLPQREMPAVSLLDTWNAYARQLARLQETEEENVLLLTQLHTVQEALELRPKMGASSGIAGVKAKSRPQSSVLTGAAERVKQQLSYRLGNTLIQQSRSIGGILSLPMALARQVREYEQDKKSRAGKKMPPIESYLDAAEAEKVREHLSFRLGKTLVENSRTPLGWIRMPFAMQKEIKAFKHRRGQRHR